MKSLVISLEAEIELDQAMTWYQSRREGLGTELQDEVLRVLEWIRERPHEVGSTTITATVCFE